ncbi:acyl-[acyl-carrier-protein] thioesterase [Tepidibacillus fermentans]|uniref:Medium-chain acyl-[acyl-carrier-protein] hydrolase n=1 Tax=Tepidibacillus fermentans TaxID=1281767 RepID=A0A4V2USF7_9BACI|nr:acyl-ACP thioesterase domain-containing protein [Tepidibacillus fermentans]TCS81272.1 medium-chain acyl-[acyl-carrier-protein] hydrolase [Tepidibacillus fermentans]
MNPVITERQYNVHYYEVDFKRRALPTTLMNYLQDIAIHQSEQAGVGLDFLEENHLAWSLYQWDISIKAYPQFGQTVTITTNACAFEKFNAYREFKITNQEGELMVYAYTRWVLLDTKKGRLTKIPPRIYEVYGIDPDKPNTYEMEKLKELNESQYKKEFSVRYSDIDTNKHVNNVKYVEWAIETLPLEMVMDHQLRHMKVMYKKEAKYGEQVQVLTKISEIGDKWVALHKIVDSQGTTLCLLETTWEKI